MLCKQRIGQVVGHKENAAIAKRRTAIASKRREGGSLLRSSTGGLGPGNAGCARWRTAEETAGVDDNGMEVATGEIGATPR